MDFSDGRQPSVDDRFKHIDAYMALRLRSDLCVHYDFGRSLVLTRNSFIPDDDRFFEISLLFESSDMLPGPIRGSQIAPTSFMVWGRRR
jgi:hypothetical protein